MRRGIGVPVATWLFMRSSWNTPERMRTWSGSLRWLTNFDWPGRRRSRSPWMSASVSGIPGGHPSTTQPSAGPWLSPNVVTRNKWPKVLNDILLAEIGFRAGGQSHDSGVGLFVAHGLLGRKAQAV